MAHEKVYGICENKCMVEVIPKDDFIIVTGTVDNVPENSAGVTVVYLNDYIDGYSGAVVLSIEQSNPFDTDATPQPQFHTGSSFVVAGDQHAYPYAIVRDASTFLGKTRRLLINVANTNSVQRSIKYKVVLLRYR